MDSQMNVGKRKIIQKRIKKKERYARMARIRYRKEKNVPLAFVQPLPDVYESVDPRTSYQFYMDLLMVEENGKLSTDYSLLNKIKICNSVSVLQEKDNMLSLKLQEYNLNGSNSWETTVKDWEARGGKYWSAWAARIRKFSLGYEEFLKDYRKMLEEGSLDKKLAQRKNEFLAKRNKIMETHPCIELRFKFEKEQMKMTELNLTSGLLSILGYRMEDFIDGILRDGFPRIHLNQNEGLLGVYGYLMDNFRSLFTKDLEIPKQETILAGQYQSVKKTLFNTVIGGFFNKTTPEINMIIMFDKPEPLRDLQFSSVYLKDYTSKKVQHDAERRSFVQRFYWDGESEGSVKQQDVCGIKQLEDSHQPEKEAKMIEEKAQELTLNLKALQASNTPPQLPMGYLGYPYPFQTFKPFNGNLLQQFEKSIELFGEKLVYLKNKY